MDLNLKGKTVLVTGGSRGIGLAVAESFAEEGCRLHLVSRTEADLAAAQEKIQAAGDVAVTYQALDLSESSSVQAIFQACPKPDILVNNAGAIPAGHIGMVDEARWREAWDLKVFGYINMCRAYYEAMRERQDGVILNVIGLAGERPSVGYIAGSAGNAGLMGFTRALGSNSLGQGVRVLGVNPGPVATDRYITQGRVRAEQRWGDPERWPELAADFPIKRAATPEEIADVVVFLTSARCAYMSGTIVTIDGGISSLR